MTDGLKAIRERLESRLKSCEANLKRVDKPDDYSCEYYNVWVVPAERQRDHAQEQLDLFFEMMDEFVPIFGKAMEALGVQDDA